MWQQQQACLDDSLVLLCKHVRSATQTVQNCVFCTLCSAKLQADLYSLQQLWIAVLLPGLLQLGD